MATFARDPALGRTRARRLAAPLGTVGGLGAAALALRVRDPHRQGAWGLCPFKAITGWNCPLCGGLRAVNDLDHGRLADAVHSNLLFVGVALPLAVAVWLSWLQGSWTGAEGRRLSPRAVRTLTGALGVLTLVFTVWRNTPWGSAWRAA